MTSFHLQEVTPTLLCGGFGTRLQASVPELPKALAPVRGRPFLSFLLDQLNDCGFTRVVLCTGYRGRQIESQFGPCYKNLEIVYSYEEKPLGTAGALANALPMIPSEWLLAINGDSYADVDLTQFMKRHFSKGAVASLVLVEVDDATRFGSVDLDQHDHVIGYREKEETSDRKRINAGIYLISKSELSQIQPGIEYSLERQLMPMLIEKGLLAFRSSGAFIDIGTSESYLAAEAFFSRYDSSR